MRLLWGLISVAIVVGSPMPPPARAADARIELPVPSGNLVCAAFDPDEKEHLLYTRRSWSAEEVRLLGLRDLWTAHIKAIDHKNWRAFCGSLKNGTTLAGTDEQFVDWNPRGSGARPVEGMESAIGIAERRLGHSCTSAPVAGLDPAYHAALAKMPATVTKLVIAYPAIASSLDMTLLANAAIEPAPLQKGSKSYRNGVWYAQEELIRSPYFAALLYASLRKAAAPQPVALAPFYPMVESGRMILAPADASLHASAMTIVDTRTYSYGIGSSAALEDQKHEAFTTGQFVTPAVAIAVSSGRPDVARRTLVYSPLDRSGLPSATPPLWSGGLPKGPVLYPSERIKLPPEGWQAYLANYAKSTNPAQAEWADKLARQIKGMQAKLATPEGIAETGEAYGVALLGGCANEVARQFTPEKWAKIVTTVLTAENALLQKRSDALYAQLMGGTYGVSLRAQMARETSAITRWQQARAAQGLSNFLSIVTNLAAGAAMGYAGTPQGLGSVNTLQLSNDMFTFNNSVAADTRARDAVRSSGLAGLSQLAAATAAPQLQAVSILGADQQAVSVSSLSELRAVSSGMILTMAGVPQ